MRCYQARNRLTESADLTATGEGNQTVDDRELLDHLQSCPECARLAEAVETLKRDLSLAGRHDIADGLSFTALRNEVERRTSLARQPSNKEYTLMGILTNPIRHNPKLSLGLAVAAVILVMATLVPFSYDRTIGYEVAFAAVDPSLALDDTRINELLGKLGVEDAVVDVTDCNVRCNIKIGSLSTPEEAHLVRAAFAGWSAVEEEGDITPVSITCSGNLIEMATESGNIIRVDVMASPDVDINQLVKERLGEEFDCNLFFCKDSTTGTVTMNLDLGAEGWADNGLFVNNGGDSALCKRIIMCSDDDDRETCTLPSLGETDCKDLTEEDLQRLRDQGYEVEVTESSDGTVRRIVLKKGETEFKVHEPPADTEDDTEADLGAAKNAQLPEGYELAQNFPNPFNPSTTISFTLPEAVPVQLEIININGRIVRTLVDARLGIGEHVYEWDATSERGDRVASGMYFYRLRAGDVVTTKKMTLLK
jgi:hypothetical protein